MCYLSVQCTHSYTTKTHPFIPHFAFAMAAPCVVAGTDYFWTRGGINARGAREISLIHFQGGGVEFQGGGVTLMFKEGGRTGYGGVKF